MKILIAVLVSLAVATVAQARSVKFPSCKSLGQETLYFQHGGWGEADCHPTEITYTFEVSSTYVTNVSTKAGNDLVCAVVVGDAVWSCAASN